MIQIHVTEIWLFINRYFFQVLKTVKPITTNIKGYKLKIDTNTKAYSNISSIHNFSGGIGVLPEKVIEGARQAILEIPGTTTSALVVNHRSQLCTDIVDEAKQNIIELLNIPDNYNIVFLQGGASLQFTMIPKNLWADKNRPVEYILTGYWSNKAIREAYFEGEKVNISWDGRSSKLNRIPTIDECNINCNASYVHYCSNESVEGLQFKEPLDVGEIPLVCDMSSDLITKPLDISRYALVYAHAQKNLGAAGVTVVIIRNDILEYIPNNIPTILDYRNHVVYNSIYNTPPSFGIYLIVLVTRWLLNDIGGLENMDKINQSKAKLLYDVIDNSKGFYRGHAHTNNRSIINIAYNLPTPELEKKFTEEAKKLNIIGLEGHRSIGGIRASLYNTISIDDCHFLCYFMQDFNNKFG